MACGPRCRQREISIALGFVRNYSVSLPVTHVAQPLRLPWRDLKTRFGPCCGAALNAEMRLGAAQGCLRRVKLADLFLDRSVAPAQVAVSEISGAAAKRAVEGHCADLPACILL